MTWTPEKKRSFISAATKHRAKFAAGGMVRRLPRRQKFVDGGTVHALGTNPTLVNNTASNPNTGVMGTIANAIGLNDQFQAGSANIQPGTNVDQLNQAYQDAQDALHNQVDFTKTVLPGAAGATTDQAALAAQELAMSRGEGPNPALAQLAEQTRKNVATTAALQAGQRGASANVGLIARQAGQQGAEIQQQAVGQEATLQAQQQIEAQKRAEALAATRVNQAQTGVTGVNTATQGEQTVLQNANTSANNAAVNMQSNVNTTNAQTALANQDVAGQIFGGIMSGASSAFGGGGGGLAKGLGSLGGAFGAEGGEVDKMPVRAIPGPHKSHVANFMFAEGGEVPAMLSPGEVYLSPEKVRQVIHEGKDPAKIGQKIAGKAKVKGDSYRNDTIPMTLQDGGVVVDRKNMGTREKRELFVHRSVAKQRAGRK